MHRRGQDRLSINGPSSIATPKKNSIDRQYSSFAKAKQSESISDDSGRRWQKLAGIPKVDHRQHSHSKL